VHGSTGCNQFNGAYTVDGDAMKLGPLATTQMACPPPADQVERDFVAKLDRVRHWRATDDELVLSDDARATLLRFRVASVAGSWEATSFLQGDAIKSAILGTHVTALFGTLGELTGSAGCNDYGATYTAARGAISIEQPNAQQRECAEPAGIMEQERAYLEALTKARRYELAGDQLTLLTDKGTIAVTYVKR
jgi:heat shock protein HslJ